MGRRFKSSPRRKNIRQFPAGRLCAGRRKGTEAIAMANVMDEKERLDAEEAKLKKVMDEANGKLLKESEGKPYLLVLVSLHEIDREKGTSRLAPQWSWHSNINSKKEGRSEKDVDAGKTLMRFMVDQLKAIPDHPDNGIKKKYGL